MPAIFPWLKKTLSQLLDSGLNKSAMMQHAEMLPSELNSAAATLQHTLSGVSRRSRPSSL